MRLASITRSQSVEDGREAKRARWDQETSCGNDDGEIYDYQDELQPATKVLGLEVDAAHQLPPPSSHARGSRSSASHQKRQRRNFRQVCRIDIDSGDESG
jgi:hypothetical protein